MAEGECVVSGALSLVLRISRMLGVAPLRIVPLKNEYRISISYNYATYSRVFVTVVCAICLIIVIINYENYSITDEERWGDNILYIQDIILSLASMAVGAYFGVNRMKKIIEYLNILEELKKHFSHYKNLEQIKSEKNIYITTVIYLGALVALSVSDTATDLFYQQDPITISYSIFTILYISMNLLQIQVILLMRQIRPLLRLMNENMELMISSAEQNVPATSTTYNNIRMLAYTYVALCDVTSKMDKIDGVNVVIIFTDAFISATSISIYFIDSLNIDYNIDIALIVLWCVFNFLRIIACVESCHKINEEVGRTNALLGKLMYKMVDIGQPLPAELDLFHSQLMLNKPRFYPLGMFILRRSLMSTTLSVILTYYLFVMEL